MPSYTAHPVSYHADGLYYAARLADLPDFVWLDGSSRQPGSIDILSGLPRFSLTGQAGTCHLRNGSHSSSIDQSLIDFLRTQIHINEELSSDLPFLGGLIGFLGYEFGSAVEREMTEELTPTFQIGYYECSLVLDHSKKRATLFWLKDCCPDVVQAFKERLLEPIAPAVSTPFQLLKPFNQDQSFSSYQASFARIQDYIHAGDCYQINYAQRFSSTFAGDPFVAYCALRQRARAPYSGFMRTDVGAIVSLSPEQFIQVRGDEVRTAPIKGTRARGATPAADEANRQSLLSSSKDRAENLMIVDLLRNDLSLHAQIGSVQVEKLFELQSFDTVHHLVSTIRARKRTDIHPLQVLFDAFPGGSITGAPKRRAMEIIAELELHPRSAYCGCLFYCSLNGNLDSNIAIRTLVCEDDRIYCWGGGGIIADSVLEEEYQESIAKVAPLLSTLEQRFLARD